MSPLALLREGEIAEIIDPDENRSLTDHQSRHRLQHGDGACHCISPCIGCSCRQNLHAANPIRSYTHLHEMGLWAGKKVEMITNHGSGPLVLRVDECRIAMERGAAMKIYVRRNSP